MAGALNLIQFYPAFGKMVSDISNLWQNKDGGARERVLQHKIDDLLILLRSHAVPTRPPMRDASTQTNNEGPSSPSYGPPRCNGEPETPREWEGIVTGMGRQEDLIL
jgi:hypothetical protein